MARDGAGLTEYLVCLRMVTSLQCGLPFRQQLLETAG
jgi:hypothetical protein